MKKFLLLVCAILFMGHTFGQLTGTYTIPGATYTTIASAITALNTQGVGAGGVIFNITAGYTETFASPTAGYITTNTGTSANQIKFQKSGSGANPKITAGIGTGTMDAIICFNGVQYITFDGIDVYESSGNTTATTEMEWGYAILKASATQGSQNITIKNCTISLLNTYTSTWGIYSNNHTIASITQLTITAASGQNSNNKFYANTITNCYNGIYLYGYADATSPYTYYDQNNDIGSVTGNIFNSFGGGASTEYMVYAYYQNGVIIANCNISGTGSGTASIYGIYGGTATNANASIYGNTISITLSAATTGYIYGIYNAGLGTSGTTNTLNIYNNTIQNCTEPSATSAYFYGIYNAASAFNVNFYGNIVNNNVIGGSGYTYTCYTTAGSGTCNVYSNTVTNNQRTGSGASGYFYCLYIGGSANNSIHDNTVSGNTSTALAGYYVYMYSIYCSNSAITQTVYNNTVHDQSVTTSYTSGYAIYGIYSYPASTNPASNSVHDNNVYNLTFTCTSSAYCYIYGIGSYYANNVYSNNVHDISQTTTTSYGYSYGIYCYYGMNCYSNNVYNITETATAGYGYGYGIYYYASGAGNIYKNKVYGVSMAGASGYYYGMYLSYATNMYVYNNYVSDIKTPVSTSTTGANGIYIGTPSFAGVYYNTVYLNGTNSSATTFISAALYASTTPSLDMRNNILVNTTTNTGSSTTFFTVAYRRSSTTLTTYAATSNNNDFYAGTPSATNVIMYDGTTSYQTLAAFKALVSPRDAQSVTELPPFQNNTTPPYDLHLKTTVATQCESGGSIVSTPAITDDYDNNPRYPNPGYPVGASTPSAPDIGADEFGGILLDLTPPNISFTPFLNTSSTSARTLTTTITDASGVPTTGIGRPVLYWKINSGAWTSATGTWVSGSTYTFLFGNGVVLNDVVSYYIVAQDTYTTPNVGSNPSAGASGFSINPPACSTPPTTPYTYTIVGTLCGTKTVGTGGDYTNLTAAVAAVNNSEMTCPVTLLLLSTYSSASETFPIVINQNSGSSTTNILTIKPNTGVTASVSGASAAGPILKILNSNTIIDGSNTTGGTTRDLTFANTSVTTPQVLVIGSTGTTPITNVTLKNTIDINGINSSSAVIVSDGATPGNAGYFNNITIKNNSMQLAYIALYCIATPATGNGSGLLITGNDFSTSGTNSVRLVGVYVQGVDGATVSTNNIGNLVNTADASNLTGIWFATATVNSSITGNTINTMSGTSTGPRGIAVSSGLTNSNIIIDGNNITNLTTSSSTAPYGIYVFSTTTNVTVKNNKVGTMLNSNTGGYGVRGIYVVTGLPASNVNLINNVVYDIKATSDASLTYYCIGMGIEGATGGVNVYHNSVYLSGTYAGYSTATVATALYVGTGTGLDVRDNIFVNTYDNTGGSGDKSYAIYCAGTNAVFTAINYNDYYVSGTPGVLGYLGGDIATLAAWKTATAQDANSINVDPVFTSTTNLLPTSAAMNNAGTYLTAVPADINATLRSNPPDMGAYEFALDPLVNTLAANTITATTATLTGTINANNFTVNSFFDYGLTTAYGSSITGVPSSVSGSITTGITGGITSLTGNTTYHYRARGVCTPSGLIAYGPDMTFTTLASPPTVVTLPATLITSTGAQLNGTVNANGASSTVIFEYGLTASYGSTITATQSPVTGTSAVPVSAPVVGLAPGTLYHFRVSATNVGGTSNGNDLTFTTAPAAPTVVTLAATLVTTTSATLNGTVNANGASTTVTFEYGLTIFYGSTITAIQSPVTGNTATPVSANIAGLTLNQTYHFRVCGTNSVGTSCGNDLTFYTGCNPPLAAGPITGPSQVCQGGCGYVYTVSPITYATGYNWSLPTGGTITSGNNTNSITVCYSAVAVSGYVAVYGTSVCGNGAPSQLPVNVNSPSIPTITGPSPVCVNSTGNVYTTQTGMTNYIWAVVGGTITAGGTTTSSSVTVTWTVTGAQTVSVGYTNGAGCATITPTVKTVTVNPTPTPTITGSATACTMFPGYIYSTQAGNTGYTWTISAGGTITAGNGTNAITVTWNTAGAQSVSVNYANSSGCSALTPTVYPVTVNAGVSPTITGPSPVCVNLSGVNYSTQSGFTNYVWTISAGGTITAGQGTSVIQVTWNVPGSQWVAVNYTNAAGCSAPAPVQFDVTINPLPGDAGNITGTADVCGGATGVAYSIATVPNTTTYVWTLPAGATIASGAGTNAITVDFDANASSGDITVFPNNICGNGNTSPPFAVTVTPLVAPAGTITGVTPVCQGQMGVAYSVNPITNATGYVWSVPAGATIASGSNTNSITVDFSMSAVSGIITVYGTNSCGEGTVSPDFNVTVNPIPPAPVVTSDGDTLYSSAPAGNQWYYEGTLILGATGQTYIATASGYYWAVVTLNGCSSDTSNHVYIAVTGLEPIQSGNYSVYPVPNDGRFTIMIDSPVNQLFTISVYNNLGIKVYTQEGVEVTGKVQKILDLRTMPTGIYSIVFQSHNNKVVRKILINR